MYLALWLISRWRLPTTPCFIVPVAVSLKRFLTPLLVLSLGIFVSFVRSLGTRRYPTATACLPAGPLVFPTIWKARAYRGGSSNWQGGESRCRDRKSRARVEESRRTSPSAIGGRPKPSTGTKRRSAPTS